jgi:hypothetical protein
MLLKILCSTTIQGKEFVWRSGKPDGKVPEDELVRPPDFYRPHADPRRRSEDEDDYNRHMKRSRSRSFRRIDSNWFGGRSRPNHRAVVGHRSGWFEGESSRGSRVGHGSASHTVR